MSDKLQVEIANDGDCTCKYLINGNWKYLYSKYKPKKIRPFHIDNTVEAYIVLGIGLGYELEHLLNHTSDKPIYAIEFDADFIKAWKAKNLTVDKVKDSRITYLFGEDFKKVFFPEEHYQIIVNKNLVQINPIYYSEVQKYFSKAKPRSKEKIVVLNHITIAEDCIDAFSNIGYKVYKLNWLNDKHLLSEISRISPRYVFTINFSKKIAHICKALEIIYISWTVDTPAYSLYDEKNLKFHHCFYFIYDQGVVSSLTIKGLERVFYLPVGVNVNRFDKIFIDHNDKKFISDISFVGTTGMENEYNLKFRHTLSDELKKRIEVKFLEQITKPDESILYDFIDESIINLFERELEGKILHNNEELLERKTKLYYLLGRKYSQLERMYVMKELSQLDLKVYGDQYWSEIVKSQFVGEAEHFNDMPKIFKLSKINLNITRKFVESGLPMRVFDILGAGGFLLTNEKKDIKRLFTLGKDLEVFRDWQDLREIINYYLIHPKAREQLRLTGQETVRNHHTFKHRLEEMMKVVNSNSELSKMMR
ncbi:glycosyltransferase family protein [Bacillus sp. AK031]